MMNNIKGSDLEKYPKWWVNVENHKIYMKWLGKKLNYTCNEDWYNLTSSILLKYKGSTLFKYYNSIFDMIKCLVDFNYDWLGWKFKQVGKLFWKSKLNRRKYIDWLGDKLGYKIYDDWYRITCTNIIKNHGAGLLCNYYKGNAMFMVMDILTEYSFNEWQFTKVPGFFWRTQSNVMCFIDWLGTQHGYTQIEDWYNVTKSTFSKYGGSGLLKIYNNSPIKLVMSIFPHYDWKEWLFKQVPNGFWSQRDNVRRYLYWLGEKLGYSNMNDWYDISWMQIQKNYGCHLLTSTNCSPINIIIYGFNDYQWDVSKFTKHNSKKKQFYLYNIIKKYYKDAVWEYRNPILRYVKSRRLMCIDIWIPSLNMAVEYQGRQHFEPVDILGGVKKYEDNIRRDKEKREACDIHGIKLLEIKYTWNGSEDVILDKIHSMKATL